jgi:hypothetical protein
MDTQKDCKVLRVGPDHDVAVLLLLILHAKAAALQLGIALDLQAVRVPILPSGFHACEPHASCRAWTHALDARL